jgi:hypothetical protein
MGQVVRGLGVEKLGVLGAELLHGVTYLVVSQCLGTGVAAPPVTGAVPRANALYTPLQTAEALRHLQATLGECGVFRVEQAVVVHELVAVAEEQLADRRLGADAPLQVGLAAVGKGLLYAVLVAESGVHGLAPSTSATTVGLDEGQEHRVGDQRGRRRTNRLKANSGCSSASSQRGW